MTRKQFGVTLASFLSNTQHPASFSPAWGGSSYHNTWRVFNGLRPSPRQVGVFQTSPSASLCPGAEIQTLPWKEGICVLFFHLPFFKCDLSPLPWGRLGSSSRAGPMLQEAAAPLSKAKNPNTWKDLKIAILAFVLKYLR